MVRIAVRGLFCSKNLTLDCGVFQTENNCLALEIRTSQCLDIYVIPACSSHLFLKRLGADNLCILIINRQVFDRSIISKKPLIESVNIFSCDL